MQISEQSKTDLTTVIETLDQRVHEMEADNSSSSSEVVSMKNLRDTTRGMMGYYFLPLPQVPAH